MDCSKKDQLNVLDATLKENEGLLEQLHTAIKDTTDTITQTNKEIEETKRACKEEEQRRKRNEEREKATKKAENDAKAAAEANAIKAAGLAADSCTLPAGWTKAWSKSQQKVFYVDPSGNSVWDCPPPPCVPAEGWLKTTGANGRDYYYTASGLTSWECPTSPAPAPEPTPEPTPAPAPTPAPSPVPEPGPTLTFSKEEVSQGTDINELNQTLPALKTYVASLTGKYYGGTSTGLKAGNLKTKLPAGWSSFIVETKRVGLQEKKVVNINGTTYPIKGQHATVYIYNDDIKTITDGVNEKGKDILVQQGGRRRTRRAKGRGKKRTRSRR